MRKTVQGLAGAFVLSLVPFAAADGGSFDVGAAKDAISKVQLGRCKVPNGPRGEGHVTLVFGSDGQVSSATVDKGDYLKSPPVLRCISAEYKKIKIPSFSGKPVNVGKTFTID